MNGVYNAEPLEHLRGRPLSSLVYMEAKSSRSVQQKRPHDNLYYCKCLVGGVLSSTIRWVLTPLDAIKCNMQVNPAKYTTFSSGLSLFYREQGLAGIYRGFLPTVLAYSSQTGSKYMMYEAFKDSLSSLVGHDQAHKYRSAIYIASAGCAEAIADILMCPWEMLKVQVQTSPNFPNRFGPALAEMIQQRHSLGFPFGSLGPLWSRQILGTVANFYTFESTAEGVYTYLLTNDKDTYSPTTQLMVTFGSGYISGFVCTVVSHPADSLISLKARKPHKTLKQLTDEVGWKNLATNGLRLRVLLTGSIIGFQWFVYDTFKLAMGMGTTGGT